MCWLWWWLGNNQHTMYAKLVIFLGLVKGPCELGPIECKLKLLDQHHTVPKEGKGCKGWYCYDDHTSAVTVIGSLVHTFNVAFVTWGHICQQFPMQPLPQRSNCLIVPTYQTAAISMWSSPNMAVYFSAPYTVIAVDLIGKGKNDLFTDMTGTWIQRAIVSWGLAHYTFGGSNWMSLIPHHGESTICSMEMANYFVAASRQTKCGMEIYIEWQYLSRASRFQLATFSPIFSFR